MVDDLKTFPSIRALARHVGTSERNMRKKLGRGGGTQGKRGPNVPMILMDVPTAIEDRLVALDKRLVEVLVRLDGLQTSVRLLTAMLEDQDL